MTDDSAIVDGSVHRSFTEGDNVAGVLVTIFAATYNNDSTEGKGKMVDRAYYRTKHEALMGCVGIGLLGGDGETSPRLALLVSDGSYVLFPDGAVKISNSAEAEAKLREQARKKLTHAELAAFLGEKR